MPRYFAPTNGFADKNIAAIRTDEDRSVEILADGSERLRGLMGAFGVWVPMWSESELNQLVAGGTWKELDAPPAPATQASEAPVFEEPSPAPETSRRRRATAEAEPNGYQL